jgi:hypothetical protein
MGEGLRLLGSDYNDIESDPLVQYQEHLQAIERLLAKVTEQGDLSAQTKRSLRQQIADHLAALGLTNLNQLADFKMSIITSLQDRVKRPHVPYDFPSLNRFAESLGRVMRQNPKEIPLTYDNPLASEAAWNGQYPWWKLEGRNGIDIIRYTFDLSKLMCDPIAYRQVFEPIDPIIVTRNWGVEGGRHRAFALKTLGEPFVRHAGLNNWINLQVE